MNTFFPTCSRPRTSRFRLVMVLAAAAMAIVPPTSQDAGAAAGRPEPPSGTSATARPAPAPHVVVPPVDLGYAMDCAVMAGTAVMNTDTTTVTGDVNVSPGTTVSGFPPGQVRGKTNRADAEARREKAAAVAAYNDASRRTPTATLPPTLGGDAVLTPGVFNTPSGVFTLAGTLKLDAQGDPDAFFIFQASTLITLRVSNIDLLNGARADNVVWAVSDDATLGTYSTFRGNLMARRSITVDRGTAMYGRTLALDEAIQINGTTDGPATRITEPNDPPTSTTLTSSPNPSQKGQPVTFTATVSGSYQSFLPTGQVLFKDGSSVVGVADLNSSAVATFTTSALPPGARQMTATYMGNGTAANEAWVHFRSSVSAVLVQQVNS
ncbi:MAG: hypothetical protein JWQ95_994 [Sphaerisporangium sp.]|nr:hypothetical protein [Sphaerisporangium sp.]